MSCLIVGGLHHNTLGCLRSIGERIVREDIYVLAVAKNVREQNLISQSKYVCKENVSYIESCDYITPWLLQHAKNDKKRIVISCSDGATNNILEHKKELSDFYLIPESKIDINQIMSKEVQDGVASSCGLFVPYSATFSKSEPLEWSLYPAIIKPIKSTMGAGKEDVCVVRNKNELNNCLKTICAEKIQIQEYIQKKMEYQLIGCSLNYGETIIIPGYTEIIRQPENTNTGYLKYAPISELQYDKNGVEALIKEIGYSGLFSIEFVRDGRKDYFLEINMRNDGNAYCVKSAGVNLPYIWYYYMKNGRIPKAEPLSVNKTIRFIPDFNDFVRGVKAEGFLGWVIQFFSAESHSIYCINDMKPFWVQMFYYIRKFFKI